MGGSKSLKGRRTLMTGPRWFVLVATIVYVIFWIVEATVPGAREFISNISILGPVKIDRFAVLFPIRCMLAVEGISAFLKGRPGPARSAYPVSKTHCRASAESRT